MIQQAINQTLGLGAVAMKFDPNAELRAKKYNLKNQMKREIEAEGYQEQLAELEKQDPFSIESDPSETRIALHEGRLARLRHNMYKNAFEANPTEENMRAYKPYYNTAEAARRSFQQRQQQRAEQENTLRERMDLLRGEEYDYETGGIE